LAFTLQSFLLDPDRSSFAAQDDLEAAIEVETERLIVLFKSKPV
jgi:hypothetical protein